MRMQVCKLLFFILVILSSACVATRQSASVAEFSNDKAVDNLKVSYCTSGELALVYNFQFDRKGKIVMRTLNGKTWGHGKASTNDLANLEAIIQSQPFIVIRDDLVRKGWSVVGDEPYIKIEYDGFLFFIDLKRCPQEAKEFLRSLDSTLLNALGKKYSCCVRLIRFSS